MTVRTRSSLLPRLTTRSEPPFAAGLEVESRQSARRRSQTMCRAMTARLRLPASDFELGRSAIIACSPVSQSPAGSYGQPMTRLLGVGMICSRCMDRLRFTETLQLTAEWLTPRLWSDVASQFLTTADPHLSGCFFSSSS